MTRNMVANAMEQGAGIASEVTSAYLFKECMEKKAMVDVADKVASVVPTLGETSYRCLELCEEKERPKIISGALKEAAKTILEGTLIICGSVVVKTCLVQHGKTSRRRALCRTVSGFSPKEVVCAIKKR